MNFLLVPLHQTCYCLNGIMSIISLNGPMLPVSRGYCGPATVNKVQDFSFAVAFYFHFPCSKYNTDQ